MAEQSGFEIKGIFYPSPTAFRLGDPVLIADLTGMKFQEFAEALGDPERAGDPTVLIGMVGVSVWQKHPKWPRARVVEFVQNLDIDAFEFVGGGDEESPPEAAGPGESLPSSDGTSNGSPDTSAEQLTPPLPGSPGLATSSQV